MPQKARFLVAGLSVLLETVAAIHGAALGGLERYFAFLSAVGTNGLVHFARRAVSTLGPRVSVFTHFSFT